MFAQSARRSLQFAVSNVSFVSFFNPSAERSDVDYFLLFSNGFAHPQPTTKNSLEELFSEFTIEERQEVEDRRILSDAQYI